MAGRAKACSLVEGGLVIRAQLAFESPPRCGLTPPGVTKVLDRGDPAWQGTAGLAWGRPLGAIAHARSPAPARLGLPSKSLTANAIGPKRPLQRSGEG